jgi:hypothetical protein
MRPRHAGADLHLRRSPRRRVLVLDLGRPSANDVKGLLEGDGETIHFQLYSEEMGGRPQFRRIDFRPGAVPGKKFRYATEGFGLIQFYVSRPFGGKLRPCHTNHVSMKAAEAWTPIRSEVASPDGWNWRHITSMSNRLNRYIRSLGVAKHGSRAILAGAQAGLAAGDLEFLG